MQWSLSHHDGGDERGCGLLCRGQQSGLPAGLQLQHGHTRVLHVAEELGRHDHHLGLCVLQHHVDHLDGVGGVHGQIGGPCLENGDVADDIVDRLGHVDHHTGVNTSSPTLQLRCQAISQDIQLFVSECVLPVRHSGQIGVSRGLDTEQVV